MIFQALAPSTEVFAQELDAVMEASVSAARAAGNTARSVQDAVATALQDADQATSDDAATTPGAGAGATEGGNGSTNAGDSQDSTTDGANSGDAPAEGDASQDDAAADEAASDEEQTNDEGADAAAQANVTYKYNTVDDLKTAIGAANVTVEADKVVGVTIGTSEDLIKLSNTNPAIYQNAAITKGGATGSGLNLCSTVTAADGAALSFLGLGGSTTPFKGSFGSGISPIVLNKPLFNNVELSTDMTLALTWKGATSDAIVATTIAGGGHKLVVSLAIAPAADNTAAVTLTSPLLGSVSGALALDATYAAKDGATPAVTIQSGADNVGLLANTLLDAASLSVEQLALPSAYSGTPTIKASKDGASAGGLIGVCGNGATVAINGNIDLSAFSVKGRAASGGLIGKATNLTLNIAHGAKIKPARNVGDKDSACSGGVIGDVSFAQGFTVTSNMFDLGDLVTLGASQRAGALFGVADISTGDIVVQGGTYKSRLALEGDGVVSGSYGGLVGKVFATAKGDDGSLRAFVVQKDADKKTCSIEFELASKLSDAGGVVGYVGDSAAPNSQPVTVVLNGVTVACKGDASARTDTGKFGGAVGVVDTRNVLDVRDFTLTSERAIGNAQSKRAAGIAGSARNAVIKFSGITNLSGASFAENDMTGQLVYENNNALIFAVGDGANGNVTDEGATGWTYKRSNTASKTDDIATYGEVIRLGDGLPSNFIALDPTTHTLTLADSLVGGAYVLNSVGDFAKLAITWQTNGYYSMVAGVTENNLNGLQSSTITVNGTIDLKGTGLTGFTQDRADGSQVFSGTLNGNGKISLAVGEPYGMRDGNDAVDGNGKIYRHGRLGLFAAVNGAAASNVTIAGSMKFDNQSNVDAGALAGVKVGGDTSLTAVTFSTGIEYESTNRDNYVHAGGVFGSISGAGSLRIGNRESLSVINSSIVSKAQERGATCVGGAVGYISGDSVPSDTGKTVEVDGLTISGSIAVNNGSVKTYAGGLIGQIKQGGFDGNSGAKQVAITKLDFANFSLATAGVNAGNSAGLLGYSWGGTEVTLGDASVNKDDSSYAITTSGSSVSSATATEFGGLVYAASGHWVINDYALNLSGVNLSAPNANKFGMLVCRAGSGVSSAGDSLVGLYLENRAPWATAYVVNRDKNAITTQATTFDEWVADGCKPGQAVDDCTVNGVVSLHTREEKLHMTDDGTDAGGARNSYENRTAYGMEHQTNGSVRYYYNLDRAVAYIKSSGLPNGDKDWIQKPEQLLVWSVSWYAPKAVRPYVWRESDGALLCWGKGRIGSMGGNASLNMTGYSYYPVDLTGINPYVYYSTIKFCFSDINKKESGNKQNSQPSQHMNMHAGLFGSYTGGKETMVLCVTLRGTIGSASGGTGALFSKFVKGQNGTASVTIDGLTLDGLSADGAKDSEYAPLLINQMASKTNLTVRGHLKNKNIPAAGYVQGITVKPDSYKTGEKAATSLFGNLGDEKAEMVTANFQDITVPSSKTDGIFTHASLLESFAYDGTKSGSSASYIFYSKKHKDEDSSFTYFEPTYGAEIDTKGNDSEYEGQQRWYNDNKGYMTDDNLVTDGSITANEDTPQFANKYLPYVYKSKEGAGEHAHDTFHEIKVNQRVSNLLTGCGTYGDPYTLTNAAEVVTVANYINGKESAADGWQITVIGDQENLCTRRSDGSKGHELIYEYKRSQGSWVCTTDSSKTLSNDTMHSYIQSAYYSIEPADSKMETLNYIELDGNSFKGFGNKDNPFRGVIVGNLKQGLDKATLKIVKKTRTISGLIPYSYGCVVKNLNVEYSDGGSVAAGSNAISYTESSDGIPASFFGGIFGCILGGDNIIDGVAVSSAGFTVAGGGTKPHLVPIGGYVGAIAGGGVIFRGMSGTSWRAGTSDKSQGLGTGNFQLYDNPYVGRVIDGYAFSEGCTVDNGDANYKINQLDTSKVSCIKTGDINGHYRGKGNNKAAVTTTVNNAQGLLVLSAIIGSGAAGGSANASITASTYGTPAGSRAYMGGNKAAGTYQFGNQQYGKVRNASYAYVGAPGNAAGDFAVAKDDDTKSPGIQSAGNALDYTGNGSDVNSPYLVKKYATWQTGYICAAQVSGMDLQFVTNTTYDYDMTTYGSGFTGLSGRYYSNACASASGADRDRIVPLVASINGNGAKIKVKNNTQEYTDDGFCAAGVGGLFNTVTFYSSRYNSESVKTNDDANVRNISFEGCDISLSYITTIGTKQSTSASNGKSSWVGTGCFAGSTANQGGSDGAAYGVFKNVSISDSAVTGGCMAGGLIGSAGLMTRSTDGSSSSIVNYGGTSSPVQLYDCSYNGITVSARSNAGGFVGYINSGACGIWVSNDKTVADSSTISIVEKAGDSQDSNSTAGGIFGLTGGTLNVNTGQGDGASQVATISDVSLIVNHNALGVGGIAGRTVTYQSNLNRVKVTSTKKASEKTPAYYGSLEASSDNGNAHAVSTGGIIGSMNNGVTLNSCTVEKIRMGVTEHAGGLVGATSNGNTLSANNITVDGVQFDGARCGGILGNCQGQGTTNVVVTNATVKNCSFGTLNSTWTHGDGSLRNHSGGIVGAASGTIKIANILISENDFKQPGGQGFLLGDTAQNAADFKGLYAAGVDIVLKDGSDNSSAPKPIKYFNDGAVADVDAKSYIAFGSYGQEPPPPNDGKTLYGDVAASGNVTAAVAPYVTTSPVPKDALSVKTASGETGQTRYLFGDGVNVSGAKTIKEDAEKGGSKHYVYTNFDGGNHWNYSPSAGEFNANNDTDATKSNANPDVLVLSGNDSDTVKDYLNIVTNGGYSDALRLNADGSHVSATVDVFQLENGVFVKQSDVTDKALDVKGSGSSLSINANTNWDNGKGRFNLLTVTFTEAGQSYRVMVPIIVKRVLEINFTATYSEGSNFNSDDYSSKYNKHVLISSGETMTGYLTWTYNKAYTQETEYGWDTHLASGGDMRPLNKRIEFGGLKGALPVGTQLTLVDTAHNNKEYHYTVPEGDAATSVALTDFVDSSEKSHYTEQWLSETMGAAATEADDGTWVKLTDEELTDGKNAKKTEAELIGIAGAKIDGNYYRLKTDADKEGKFYNLTVPKKGANEQPKSESFYLVVRTPMNSANVNGYTGTSVKTSVNTHINYVLRKDEVKDSLDSHENTASTYSVATNFQHNLVDNKTLVDGKTSVNQMAVKGTTYPLEMNVRDTITFGEQEYTSTDALYYQLDSSLVNYEGGKATGAHGYPTGTQGTYSFYVQVGDTYYKWDRTNGWKSADTEEPAVKAKSWASKTGGDMSLVLADGSGAIDLSGIREIAKNHRNQFTITMKANLTMTEPACQAGIIASQNSGNDKYTKPNYRAYLSMNDDTLSTSSNSAYNDGGAGYYRMDVGSSTIALEASKKSQLGINIDDLKSADGTIALVGTYDLSRLSGGDSKITAATTVAYSLSLQRRQKDGRYLPVDEDISKYITVLDSDKLGTGSLSGSSYVFTDAKTNGAFATRDGNSLAFKHAFRVKVNTNVEKTGQTYANYRLVLTAHMSGGGVNDMPVNASNLAGYAHSDYVTYTLARINTGGIPHETKSN